eukprot:10821203-Heterocapsa_arctica.AAC.1
MRNQTAGTGLESRKAVRRACISNGGVWGREPRPRHQHPPHGLTPPTARGKRSAAPGSTAGSRSARYDDAKRARPRPSGSSADGRPGGRKPRS